MKRRILFLGQKPLGERCFEFLLASSDSSFQVCGVVTNTSLNVWWKSRKIYNRAREKNIQTIDNKKRNSNLIEEMIRTHNINTIISVQHPWIIPDSILKSVRGYAFNLHNAKLPDYKGHNTCNHAILNNEHYYSCTIHWMADTVDMGDIIIEEKFEIEPDEHAKSLYEKAYEHGYRAFQKFIYALINNKGLPRKKIRGLGHFYSRHSIEEYKEIKDLSDFEEVNKKSRACFFPYFGIAFTVIGEEKYYVAPTYNSPKLVLNKHI